MKIVNIFSYQDTHPDKLVEKLEELKDQEKLGTNISNKVAYKRAIMKLNEENDYTRGDWNALTTGASLIVAAWGNCGSSSAAINQKKSQVCNLYIMDGLFCLKNYKSERF